VSDANGNVVEILSIGTDITEQRRAEDAIRELNATLEQRVTDRTAELNLALIRAEAADKIKSAFLATMSHELRTPLNSIIGFTGIILQELAGPINQEQAKQLGMVRGSARHLLEVINDVLDISKIEAGQLEIHIEIFDLRESIERVMTLIKPMVDKKDLTFTGVIHSDVDKMVNDRRRLEQVLINLLNNAIKFTERGSVILEVDIINDYIPPTESLAQTAVRFKVKDTGIGIKLDDLTALFQPFKQIDSGITRQYDGSGLGLAICRRLCAMMGGEIAANSEWLKGSMFTVILPLHKLT
jgi:signal transduction histidine kinase